MHTGTLQAPGERPEAARRETAMSADLFGAIRSRDAAAVRRLLTEGVDPNAADGEGRTVLMLAAASGQNEIARVLLEQGAEVDRRRPEGATALHAAASQGHTEMVRLLLEAGAD